MHGLYTRVTLEILVLVVPNPGIISVSVFLSTTIDTVNVMLPFS